MGFSVVAFVFYFLPAAVAGYYLLSVCRAGMRMKNLYLIGASAAFYAAGGSGNLGVLTTILLVTYACAYVIRSQRSKLALVFGIVINLAILVKYKYPALVLSMIGIEGIDPQIIFPLGLSFIIFHSISYLVDSWKLATQPEATVGEAESGEFVNVALYLLFFPKVLQGPIVPYADFRPQILLRSAGWDDLFAGAQRFILGLAKKVIVADEFGRMVAALPPTQAMDAPTAWLGVIAFGFQLYFDFSAYSDMALGLARMFGFRFAENFDFPYHSTSIGEFWRRWHISLGTWFRTYIYIPLGGNRQGSVYLNLFTVFILTGLWHGNTLIYLFWGVAHGLVILLERTPVYRALPWHRPGMKVVGWFYTMVVVFIGWLCFWQPSVGAFLDYLLVLGGVSDGHVTWGWQYFYDVKNLVFVVAAIVGMYITSRPRIRRWFAEHSSRGVRGVVINLMLAVAFVMSYIGMVSNSYTPFLYFQF